MARISREIAGYSLTNADILLFSLCCWLAGTATVPPLALRRCHKSHENHQPNSHIGAPAATIFQGFALDGALPFEVDRFSLVETLFVPAIP